MLVRTLALLAFCLAVLPAHADEAQIRKVIEAKTGGARIESIKPAPLLGLYEVVIRTQDGPQIVYTDADATGIIVGSLYDVKHDRNLTNERMHKLLAVKFDSLPLQDAVKIRRGSGRRVLVMFSDPYCPACQKFEKELAKVGDITIYVFMYPVIHPELASQSKAIWCSPDRAKAWLDLALRGKRPTADADCPNPIEKNLFARPPPGGQLDADSLSCRWRARAGRAVVGAPRGDAGCGLSGSEGRQVTR